MITDLLLSNSELPLRFRGANVRMRRGSVTAAHPLRHAAAALQRAVSPAEGLRPRAAPHVPLRGLSALRRAHHQEVSRGPRGH